MPGTKPSASPPRTRKIGYGTRSAGAATSRAAIASSKPMRISWSSVPKAMARGYAAPTLLRMCGICGLASVAGSAEPERAGHRFRTHGDTEVLLHLYEQHGDRFAELLRGMFAVAIWDAARRRLVLARDRFGIKPLYYREGSGELAFASELRALPRGEIDLDALEAFLAFNSIPAPLTIF